MRNPLPVLAVVLLTAVGAFAGDLPTWTTKDEGTWREVNFTDAAGAYHSLYCRWSDCGTNVKSGQAKLYILERTGSVPYTTYVDYRPEYAETYAGKTWEWLKAKTTKVPVQSAKTSFKSQLSRFVIDLSSNKAVIPGTDVSIAVDPGHASFDNINPIWRVEQPSAQADDAPKPPKPQPKPEPKPGQKPVPLPKPKPKPHTKPTPKPKPAPGAHAATELAVLERYWMIPAERSAYDDSVDASKKPNAAALQAAYKKGRETVGKNLRDELKAPYATLVGGGQFDQIDALLEGKNYAGYETMLKPDEYEALKKVLKTADAHTDFVAPNAAAQYDLEMKVILGPDGKPKLNEHLLAHQITDKFRRMLPSKPGERVDPAAPLTDADWAKITDQKDRDALKKQYDDEFAKEDTPEKKAAVNAKYRGLIDKWVADHPAPKPPRKPFDPASIDSLDKLKALAPEDQKKFCSMSTGEGVAASCSDLLDATNGAMTDCVAKKGAGAKDDAAKAKAKRECMETIHPECKGAPNAPLRRKPLADLNPDIQAYCATLLGGAVQPPPVNPVGGTPSAIDKSPCPGSKAKPKDAPKTGASDHAADKDVDPCPKKEDDKPDPNFYTNLGNGLSFGVGGLLLASFFGGPALMLAVGLAAGVGGYFWSKSVTEPKKDKDKK